MNSINSLNSLNSMNSTQREKYEWAQIWWDNANDGGLNRVLLIGDSISVGYRTPVQELFGESVAVDLLATSKSIDDPSYIKEIEYMMSQYSYSLIHFNNGIHGLHMDIETYKTSYEYVLKYLLKFCKNIIIASSTPATNENDHSLYSPDNEIIAARNAVVIALASTYSLPINDLYSAMDNHPDYKRDSYHYKDEGIIKQAELVHDAIVSRLL